jgi:hypothetical protein
VRRTGALPCEFMEADVNCVLDLDDTQIDQLFAMLRNSMTVSH